jgi:Mor family transcriptional regulator
VPTEAALLNEALGLAAGATLDERLERARRYSQMFGARMKAAKLTEKTAAEIRERYLKQGERVVTLAREYGVSEARCYEVIRKKAWKPL